MQIKKLHLQDLDSIYEISQEQFDQESWSKVQYEDCLREDNNCNLGVFINNVLISYVICLQSIDDVNILLIATKQEFKRNGYANMLCLEVIKKAMQTNRSISLEVKSTNTSALCLYQKLGFVQEYVRKRYYKDGTDAIIMFKRSI